MTANTTALLFLVSAALVLGADVDSRSRSRSRARALWRWDSGCDGDPALCVSKRLGVGVEPVACACEARPGLQDLGPEFYPRYLPYVVCSVTAECWSPPYRCATRDYTVHVLTRRETPGVSSDDGVKLPAALRNDWALQEFTVGVACECSLELPAIN